MSLALYVPGDSPIHRLQPALKVLSMVLSGTVLFFITDWRLLTLLLSIVMILYKISGISPRILIRQLIPAAWLLGLLFLIQALTIGWIEGVIVVIRFTTLILLASLVSLTTRTSELINSFETFLQPLSVLGVNVSKVSLALSMTLRFIPVIADIVMQVREAQHARGLDKSLIAIAIPVIIKTLKMADEVSDAIIARSYESS